MSAETIMGRGHCACGAEFDVWLEVDVEHHQVSFDQAPLCPDCRVPAAVIRTDVCTLEIDHTGEAA